MLRARAAVLLGLLASCSVYPSTLFVDDGPGPGGSAGSGPGGAASTSGGMSDSAGEAPGGRGGSPTSGGSGTSVAGTATAGADTDPEPTAGAGGVPAEAPRFELIDDMEDGDAFIVSAGERNGHWDIANDGTPDATQRPPAAGFVMAELMPNERPNSAFAAYTQGAGFKDWGAFMTVSMRTWPVYEETPVYDASRYSGVAFYARAGAGSDLNLRVRYIGAQTDARGGECTPGGSIETACYDHFYADVKLSHTWERYELWFADFRQAGVGKSFPSMDLASMYALELFFPGRETASGNAFELWLDDLAFVER